MLRSTASSLRLLRHTFRSPSLPSGGVGHVLCNSAPATLIHLSSFGNNPHVDFPGHGHGHNRRCLSTGSGSGSETETETGGIESSISAPTTSNSISDPVSGAGSCSDVNPEVTLDLSYESIANTAAHYLEGFHDAISFDILPWSATIPLAALCLRVTTLPVLYYAQMHRGRAAIASKELPRIHHFVRNSPGSMYQKYVTFRRLRSLTLRAAGTAPIHQMPWNSLLQIPVVITASMGLRALAMRGYTEWQNDGGLFFAPDLLAPDPSGTLPVMTTMLWLWNTSGASGGGDTSNKNNEINVKDRSKLVDLIMTRLGNGITITLQVIAVTSLVVTTELPTGIILFWTSNGILTALQRFLLSREGVRKQLGLVTKTDIDNVQLSSSLMPAIEESVESIRKELSYIQNRILQTFPNRAADEELCLDVNRMLKRERFSGRISTDLQAEIRRDEENGRAYVAVVRRGST